MDCAHDTKLRRPQLLRGRQDERRRRQRSFENGREAATSFFCRNRFDGAGVNLSHAAADFFIPSGGDGLILHIVQAFEERANEVGAFRCGKRESLFQKFRGFLGHDLILAPNGKRVAGYSEFAIDARIPQAVE
jgi:hypothetical protein